MKNYNTFLEDIENFEKNDLGNKNIFNIDGSNNYKNILLNEKDIYKRIYIYSSIYEKHFLENNKENAAFYTNLDIASEMINLSLSSFNDKELLNKKILDPAVGSGIFIFSLISYLDNNRKWNKDKISNFLNNNVFTRDIDNKTTNFFIFLINNILKFNYNKNLSIKSFFEEENKYDIIIGNPPYGLSLPEEKIKTANRFNIKKGELSNDSYGLFYIKALSLLKDNGNIVFITPGSFLNIKQHYGLRKYIINDLDTIILLNNNVFKNNITNLKPGIETVICKIIKNNKNKNISIINNKKIEYSKNEEYIINYSDENIIKIEREDIKKIYHLPISFYLTKNIIKILTDKKYNNIKYYFESAMGIKTANNGRFVNDKNDKNYNDIFIKGTSREDQRKTYSIFDYIDFKDLVNNRPKNSNIPQEKFLNKDIYKIAIPEIGHKGIMTSFKYKEEYVSNSIWIYIAKKEFYSENFIDKSIEIFNSDIYIQLSKVYSNNLRLEKHVIDNLPYIINN